MHAEARKRAKHGPMYSAIRYDFHGVAFEVGGAAPSAPPPAPSCSARRRRLGLSPVGGRVPAPLMPTGDPEWCPPSAFLAKVLQEEKMHLEQGSWESDQGKFNVLKGLQLLSAGIQGSDLLPGERRQRAVY